jgi:signal transduction histidine kinase
MWDVLGCITVDHDLRLVGLAGLICLLASVTAIELCSRALSAAGRAQAMWILGTGFVAGCGVWATHFVAMLAYRTHLSLSYELSLTTLSIVIAVVLATAGVAIAVVWRAALIGGAVVGIAIGAMHYTGMAALSGPVETSFDAAFVAASLMLGTVFGALAFAVAARGARALHRALAAVVLTVGICAMHFTGMTAVTLTPIATAEAAPLALDPAAIAMVVAAIAILLIGFAFVSTMVDRHLAVRAEDEAKRLRTYVLELEATKRNLERASRELEKALAASEESDKSKSQFLASMSHELRTPLNAIIGYSELIYGELYGAIGDERYVDYAGHIRSSGAHLLSLINDVLDVARLDAGRVSLDEEAIDIGEAIDEAMRLVTPQANDGELTLRRFISPDVPFVSGDRRRLRQVLLNLLSNAVKFTPAGGRVMVNATATDDGVAIAVSDTGIGMRAEDIPTALDRFGQIDSRLARRYEGTGLGLPLAKELMELHRGTLTIASEVGVGTTVTVVLPRERMLFQPRKMAAAAR